MLNFFSRAGLENIFLKGWRPYAWLALFIFAVFGRIILFDFTYLDDNSLIIENYPIMKNLANAVEIFKRDPYMHDAPAPHYRPLHILSFMFDAQLGGVSPAAYHLTNIFTHLLAVWLLFTLLKKLGYKRSLSFVFAALFAVHPVSTQALAWIPGRIDPQMAVFVLLSFIGFLNFLAKRQWWYYLGHLLFYFLALLVKETAIGFALIAPLYVWLVLRSREKRTWASSLGAPALALVWLAVRQLLFAQAAGYSFAYIARSIAANSAGLLAYAGKIFFPFNLSAMAILRDSPPFAGAAAGALILALLFLSRSKRWNYVLFGAAWFALFTFPVLVKLLTYPVLLLLENRTYLPMIGFIFILLEIDYIKKAEDHFPAFLAGSLAVFIFFSVLTIRHSGSFRDSHSLWANVAVNSPHFTSAYVMRAQLYFRDQKLSDAERECREGLKVDNLEPSFYHLLGGTYLVQGRYRDAEEAFLKELSLAPSPQAYVNLGFLYQQAGRLDLATKAYRDCLKLDPLHPEAHTNLGSVYLAGKRLKPAETEYQKALALDPSNDVAMYSLGLICERRQQLKKAEEYWTRAVAANTRNIDAYRKLFTHCVRRKLYKQAVKYFDDIQQIEGTIDPALLQRLFQT